MLLNEGLVLVRIKSVGDSLVTIYGVVPTGIFSEFG